MNDQMMEISQRMKLRLKTGETRKELEKYLKYCHWRDRDIKLILDRAERLGKETVSQ